MELLRKYTHHFPKISSLYGSQKKAITNLLNWTNTLAIIPTGGGKSLIYQLVSLELPGVTLVVSPLLALMQEQVTELRANGVSAVALNSNMSFDDQRELLRNLKSSTVKLIYLSPERLQNGLFRASLLASGINISMIVIDEAHCISQWGQGFRPDYDQILPFIKFIKSNKNNPVVLTLTATLSKRARKDIIKEFDIKERNIIRPDSILRKNLISKFKKVSNEKKKIKELESFLREKKPKKTLAYLYSKRECETYARTFSALGFKTDYFHAALEPEEKDRVYNEFLGGKIELLFATTAFGMGINIPDIDSVVHIHIPNSVEEYYQHIGRGGRDTARCPECFCLALWSEVNFKKRKGAILSDKFTEEMLERSFKQLSLNKKAGKIVSKDKEDYLASSDNLHLVKYYFEKEEVLTTIGEINGSPLKITFQKNTPLWDQILKAAGGIDSFILASNQSGVKIESIIQHLYEQEFKGNVKKLPARSRQLFFKSNYNTLPKIIAQKIIRDANIFVDFRVEQLEQLHELFSHSKPNDYIKKILN
jgi:ATP-dependent DNA helicase RecQ